MRFESVLCLPVWSFDGPSRPTGYVLVRFANLYWLVTVSGFQGSSCSGFPTYPAVLPAACCLACVKRQGDTLLIRTTRVNNLSEHFFGQLSADVPSQMRDSKSASRSSRKALAGQHVNRVTAASRLLCDRLRTAFRFQHALRSPVGSGGAATKITTARAYSARGFSRLS
jgi:hypothetical protein